MQSLGLAKEAGQAGPCFLCVPVKIATMCTFNIEEEHT